MKFLAEEYNDILVKLDRIEVIDEWAEKTLEELGKNWECFASLGGNFQSSPYVYLQFRYKKTKAEVNLSAGVKGQWIRLDNLYVVPMLRSKTTDDSYNEVQHKLGKFHIKDVPTIVDYMKAIPTISEVDPNPMSYFEKRLMEYEKKKKIEEDFKKRRKSK
jgi:hypothetical protein